MFRVRGKPSLRKLGELAVVQYELFEKARRGGFLNVGQVIGSLKEVYSGQEPLVIPILASGQFTRWREFRIGGIGLVELLKQLKDEGFGVCKDSSGLMERGMFPILPIATVIETIILSPRNFGYTEGVTFDEFLNPARLMEWNIVNDSHLKGYVIDLLPAEAGPHIRQQIREDESLGSLRIAMEPIADKEFGTNKKIFALFNESGEKPLLKAIGQIPYCKKLHPDSEWLFWLRKKKRKI